VLLHCSHKRTTNWDACTFHPPNTRCNLRNPGNYLISETAFHHDATISLFRFPREHVHKRLSSRSQELINKLCWILHQCLFHMLRNHVINICFNGSVLMIFCELLSKELIILHYIFITILSRNFNSFLNKLVLIKTFAL
jgi:hypothetical protein